MDLAWTSSPPTVPGLYWRRDGPKASPYLTLVFVGTQGLMVRVVDASHSWNDGNPLDRPLNCLNYGEWAGPLGSQRVEHIKSVDTSTELSLPHTPRDTAREHRPHEVNMEGNGYSNMTETHATMIGCPACDGVVQMQSNRQGHQQFVCTVGHAFALDTLYQAKEEQLERAQWSTIVLMEHLVMILQMFQTPVPDASPLPGQQINQRLRQLEQHIAAIRATVEEANVVQTEAVP